MVKKLLFTTLMLLAMTSMALAKMTVVIAHDATYPPMEFVDKDKNVVGYSVEYMDAVAKETGIEVIHKNVAWDGIFAGLANSQYDMIASSVSITPARQKAFDFSAPYFETLQGVVLPATSTAKSADDLKGKVIGGQMGTTGVFLAKKLGFKTQLFDEIGFSIEALYTGRVDAVFADESIARDYALNNKKYIGKLKVGFVIQAPEPEYYGFVVKKGNTKLIEVLNKGIAAVEANGTGQKLRLKWIGGE